MHKKPSRHLPRRMETAGGWRERNTVSSQGVGGGASAWEYGLRVALSGLNVYFFLERDFVIVLERDFVIVNC